MENYKNILIAVDLHPDCDKSLLEHAIKIAKEHQAKITLIHAVEHLNAYGVAQAYPSVLEVEEKLIEESREGMEQAAKAYDIADANLVVETGSPKMVILDYVKENNIDLIVLGSHGRHGIQLLLGSTANAVLHNATCDVLAVRIK